MKPTPPILRRPTLIKPKGHVKLKAMGKFERILAAMSALPEKRREEIAAILEELFHGDIHADDYALSDEQIADLRRRVSEPGDIASDAETEAFFSQFRA